MFVRSLITLCAILFVAVPISLGENLRIVKVGFLGSLTGPYAEISHRMIAGARLALDECAGELAERGAKLELVIEDDGLCDPARTRTAIQKFTSIDRVDAILVWAYSAAQPIRSALGGSAVPVIFAWDSNPGIDRMGDNFYGTGPDAELATRKIVEDIARDRMQRVGILALTDEWVDRVRGVLLNIAEEKRLYVTVDETLTPGVDDYRGVILRAKQKSVDALVVLGYSSTLVTILKQIRQVWPSVRIYTIGQPARDLRLLGAAGDGIVVVNGWVTGALAEKLTSETLNPSQEERSGDSPTDIVYNAYGYQGGVLVCRAVARALQPRGSVPTPEALNAAIRQLTFNIGLGEISPGRSTQVGESLLVWREGHFYKK
jgi:branched-chain amino acid transport system substrate-binding protein